MMNGEIINKVANSGLVTIDLEEFYTKGERLLFDLKPLLFQGLILKEKDLRDFVKTHDWSQYQNKYIALTCSSDAIIPTWAYMLISLNLQPYAKKVVHGNVEILESILFEEKLKQFPFSDYQDKRVVIKGCSNLPVPVNAYVHICNGLIPYVRSMMYGEPCSTVPLYKSPKPTN